MDERVRFVVEADRQELSMTGLCALYGISRETGYTWLARYRRGGFSALSDLSRARNTQSEATPDWMSTMIRTLREEHPHWGPKKLRAVLARTWPALSWPAASTIGDLLGRHGLIKARQVWSAGLPQSRSPTSATAPNDLWCIDFKGWFRTGDGHRCDPLTVSDACSRYLLLCKIVSPTTEGVWPACQRLFLEHGQPRALRMDNGTPFGSQGAAGLTKL